MKKIAIIGGGAAGLVAAITAAKNDANVTIYEAGNELGHKIRSTGNGRCNLTNMDFRLAYYHSDSEINLNIFFEQFDNQDAISFFRELGLMLYERDGYIYPLCNQASVVRDILEKSVIDLGVTVKLNSAVTQITNIDDEFFISTDNSTEKYSSVIMACGSYAGLGKEERLNSNFDGYSLSYHLGHSIIPVKPALAPIICNEKYPKELAGVRNFSTLYLLDDDKIIASDEGELQFTDSGISGIVSFSLSRFISRGNIKNPKIIIDLLPQIKIDEFENILKTRSLIINNETTYKDFLTGILNDKINLAILKILGFNPADKFSITNDSMLYEIAKAYKEFEVIPTSVKKFQNAQCCSGGVSLDEIDNNTMSRHVENLYFTGEMLDVDGKCGGYNLQWAWTTGYLAGLNASKN